MKQNVASPHRRFNPLTEEWILVSAHRSKRPWQGQIEKTSEQKIPSYDKNCYLCPGNRRANGERNPSYTGTHVFTNDFQAIVPDTNSSSRNGGQAILKAQAVQGTCRVVCFSPLHNITLTEMSPYEIYSVIDTWNEQLIELGKEYIWPQIFENKGAIMGCSNPHPHGQIWASNNLPTLVEKENNTQKKYFKDFRSLLLLDYIKTELEEKERIVTINKDWITLVPYWAIWPFETMILPRSPLKRLTEISDSQKNNLSNILKETLVRYDNLFEISFPYSMGLHGAPMDNKDYSHWQFHIHFYPPLLRSASVKKFMVGYEMMAEPQRDLTPEQAAKRLRGLSSMHYKERKNKS